jgi:CRISPR-associated endonuclease Csn1
MTSKQNFADLQLAFDVGHSSIGWAVLQRPASTGGHPHVLGTGVVIFGADDCLASKRRRYRQQRRHARATRKRIELLARFLTALLKDERDAATTKFLELLKPYVEQTAATRQLQGDGDSFAWKRAAEILAAARDGSPLPEVGWPELWDILRWYAHNRGYFAPPWANRGDEATTTDADDAVPDTEKVEHANTLMRELGTATMAETIAAYTARYEREAAEWQQGKRKEKPKHFKGLNAAFLREKVVWPEVRALLTALKGKLPKLDDAFIRTLLGNDVDPLNDRDAWRTLLCPAIQLPKRYHGGLLFGQVIPRFENRIIGVCPIHFAKRRAELLAAGFSPADAQKEAAKQSKLPSKATREFLRYRWAMQIANIFGAKPGEPKTRPLTADERKQLTALAEKQGAFTKGEFKEAVRRITGWPEKPPRDNLDALL